MIGTILPLPAPPSDGNLGPIPLAQITDENKDDKKLKEQPPAAAAPPAPVATHTRTIGIIHPPPDIRMIIEKTATFVAKNGPEFEKRILANNAGNAKFNFLIPSDPYHAYYQHRVSEFRSQQQQPPAADSDSSSQQQQLQQPPPSPDSAPAAPSGDSAAKPDPAAPFRIPARKVLEPPEAEQYTVRLPEGITGEELDIIKLTAQFVARNGKGFLNNLSNREATNPQFHFLRPTHSMFTFFTALTDAYSKVLMPPKGVTEKIRSSARDMTTVLERCLHRLEWERSQEQARQKAEDEIEQERQQMAMIDWHDFVVVETIEFADDEDEELPVPMTLEEVIRRSKMSVLGEEEAMETAEPGKEMEMEMDEEEVQLVEEGMRAARLEDGGRAEKKGEAEATAAPTDEPEPPMRIVKNWKRPEERIPAERDPTKFVISPITGELIPVSEMAEHMRISLIDPKYKEQKERMMAKIRETTLAADDEISRNIVGLARTRPDIFGTTEEEVSNAVKAEIEKKDEQPKQVIWDGHSGSIGRTATQALSQNLSGEEQADTISDDGRTLPGPAPPPRPGVPSVRPLPPPPPGLALNIPRFPPNVAPYSAPATSGGMMLPPPRPGIMSMAPSVRPAAPPMSLASNQQPVMMSRPPMPQGISVSPSMPIPPPPGSQFTPLMAPRPFVPMPMPPPNMPTVLPPPLPQGLPPPPPPEEAPPPLPDEPEPKRPRTDDVSLIPEDHFLTQHPGPARISVSVPNVDEGNLKGQLLEITVQSLSETVGSLKEKIAGEIQLPANKQKLSSRAGFLKDNLTLAYYNIGPGETLSLALRERGGRKK
ncbi:probable splicing factor 3A subunit 1 [Phoenix dactylifera]|uniref:Probable splicing factor 3A subunit 1 n=1 Tax=Phoenix dactylifera TaxID=42345 RepID=A0A8B9AZI0_PHODC|nr:probable splicing factor 3A subunit 1 [Phoenix dactylifera]